jgi:hypothetical protein
MPGDDKETVRRVVAFFIRNPSVADTFEGIARWRLLEQTVIETVETTRSALRWLVAEGILEELPQPAGMSLFRLRPEKTSQAKRLLRVSKQRGAPRPVRGRRRHE